VKELSVFIDESGDFGEYSPHSPYYIITMVFHDQSNDIREALTKLNYLTGGPWFHKENYNADE
jgi:hypothetical protein